MLWELIHGHEHARCGSSVLRLEFCDRGERYMPRFLMQLQVLGPLGWAPLDTITYAGGDSIASWQAEARAVLKRYASFLYEGGSVEFDPLVNATQPICAEDLPAYRSLVDRCRQGMKSKRDELLRGGSVGVVTEANDRVVAAVANDLKRAGFQTEIGHSMAGEVMDIRKADPRSE